MAQLADGLTGGAGEHLFCAAGDIRWREWDGDVVAYVGSTGCTHLVTPAAGAVLAQLLSAPQPLSARALAGQLFESDDEAPVRALLRDLERIGLARAC